MSSSQKKEVEWFSKTLLDFEKCGFVYILSVPLVAPTILSLQRTNPTSALVEWEPLKPQDLRGNLTSYVIVYFKLSSDTSCLSPTQNYENSTFAVEAVSPVYSISERLDPTYEYCVGIAAVTGAGAGVFSYDSVSCECTCSQLYTQ